MEEAVMDTQESTTALKGPREAEPFPLKFSASYASRYHNCHGSANLEQAIEGFVHPDRNDRGMKGEGTIGHKIFQEILEQCRDTLTECADLIEELAALNYRVRRPIIDNQKSYIIWWFMKKNVPPPVPYDIVSQFHWITVGEAEGKTIENFNSMPPRRMVFLAEGLRYVRDMLNDMVDPTIVTEMKVHAEWLTTRPYTSADIIVYDATTIHVVDVKFGDIEVSPMGNEQLLYYLKTWLKRLNHTFKDMRVHIVQRNNMDYYPVTLSILEKWVVSMQESEAAILDGDLTLTPGDHCKFCPANPHGRGDRGSKSCPVMLAVLYGERDAAANDEAIVGEGDYEDE